MSRKQIDGYIIHLNEKIGQGSTGSVYKGYSQVDKKAYAAKMLQKVSLAAYGIDKNQIQSEIKIIQSIKSQNVVGFVTIMESSNYYYIIQELCDSDLRKQLKKCQKFSEEKATDILKQICNGCLAYVKEGVSHRDLKPQNIFLKDGKIKIGDFGASKKNLTKNIMNSTTIGTPLYMSPQALKCLSYTSKNDIWALGIIFYEMLHGQTPWTGHGLYQLIVNIETKPLVIDQHLDKNIQEFLRRSLQIDQKQRMTWDEVFNSPLFGSFFTKYISSSKMFEIQFKCIMQKLKQRVRSQNYSIKNLLAAMGFDKSDDKVLHFKQFYRFLKNIMPKITKQESLYIFEKFDQDGNGVVTVQQIQIQMKKYQISSSQTENIGMSTNLLMHMKQCFRKFAILLAEKKMTLEILFKIYNFNADRKMKFEEFQRLILKIDDSFSRQDIQIMFDYIDVDCSNSIQFEELSEVYSQMNLRTYSELPE